MATIEQRASFVEVMRELEKKEAWDTIAREAAVALEKDPQWFDAVTFLQAAWAEISDVDAHDSFIASETAKATPTVENLQKALDLAGKVQNSATKTAEANRLVRRLADELEPEQVS